MDAHATTTAPVPESRVDGSRDGAPATASAVDLVRSIVAPWQRGDFSALGWADPEIEYVLVDGPSPGRWAGLIDMSAAFYEVLSPYTDYRVTAEEFRELGDGRVLVLHSYSGVGKTSGLQIGEIASTGADLFHLRDGRVTRLVLYWECERALADLGIAARNPRPGRCPHAPQGSTSNGSPVSMSETAASASDTGRRFWQPAGFPVQVSGPVVVLGQRPLTKEFRRSQASPPLTAH